MVDKQVLVGLNEKGADLLKGVLELLLLCLKLFLLDLVEVLKVVEALNNVRQNGRAHLVELIPDLRVILLESLDLLQSGAAGATALMHEAVSVVDPLEASQTVLDVLVELSEMLLEQ